MSDNNMPTSGGNADTSGSAEPVQPNQPETPTSGGEPKAGSYPESFVEKLKKEKDNSRKEVHALKAQMDELNAQIQASKDGQLQEKEQYKALWEQEREKTVVLSQDLDAHKTQKIEDKKRSSVREELFKLGLNPEHEEVAFKLVDTSSVIIDSDTNVVVGSEDVAKQFYQEHKSLGLFGRSGPNVSHQAPTMQLKKSLKDMTRDEMRESYKKRFGST